MITAVAACNWNSDSVYYEGQTCNGNSTCPYWKYVLEVVVCFLNPDEGSLENCISTNTAWAEQKIFGTCINGHCEGGTLTQT